MVYLRCRNCGRYLLNSELGEGGHCSAECAEQYRTCTNCGGFFPAELAYRGQYCCPDCGVQYKMSRFTDAATHRLMEELA